MPYVVIRRRCGNKSGVRHKAISLDRNGGGVKQGGGIMGEHWEKRELRKLRSWNLIGEKKKSRENIETVIFD